MLRGTRPEPSMSSPPRPTPAAAGSRFSGSTQGHHHRPTASFDSQGCQPDGTTPRKPEPSSVNDGVRHQQAFEPHSALGEYHSGFDADAGAISTRRATHQRHLSFPNLLPIAIRNRSLSPERRAPRPATPDEMPYTGDGRMGPRNPDAARGGGLASWLSPGSQGRGDSNTPRGSPSSSQGGESTPTRVRDPATPKGQLQGPSRFAALASSMTATLSRLTQTPVSPTFEDELLNLDVEKALFPLGPPSDRDVFSPSAFKNLHANASGLLRKMQSAYRQRTTALHELASEKSAQLEELEEAETRSRHLRAQLEGMAVRAAQQEAEMKALADELAAERRARVQAEQRLMREKGLPGPGPASEAGSSLVSEDLGADEDGKKRRRRWRKSLKSDGSFETTDDDDLYESGGEDESIFSRSRSPTLVPDAAEGPMLPGGASVSHPRVVALGQQGRGGGAARSPPMNALQKLVKNVMTSAMPEDEYVGPGCRNCKGQDASFAWNTVSLLRDENKHLKQRVGQLEMAVDGALDLANGIGLDLR